MRSTAIVAQMKRYAADALQALAAGRTKDASGCLFALCALLPQPADMGLPQPEVFDGSGLTEERAREVANLIERVLKAWDGPDAELDSVTVSRLRPLRDALRAVSAARGELGAEEATSIVGEWQAWGRSVGAVTPATLTREWLASYEKSVYRDDARDRMAEILRAHVAHLDAQAGVPEPDRVICIDCRQVVETTDDFILPAHLAPSGDPCVREPERPSATPETRMERHAAGALTDAAIDAWAERFTTALAEVQEPDVTARLVGEAQTWLRRCAADPLAVVALAEAHVSRGRMLDMRTAQLTEAPIPMVLHCPECRGRHVDKGPFATKPHHTHSCQSCGFTWRPAVIATVGVQFLPGFKDDPAQGQDAPLTEEEGYRWGERLLRDPVLGVRVLAAFVGDALRAAQRGDVPPEVRPTDYAERRAAGEDGHGMARRTDGAS
jgi:hypothetical protein